RERDGNVHDEIVAAPLVRVGARDARHDDEIACRPTVLAGLALALQADLRAVLHARLHLHRVRLDPPLAAGAVAVRARLLDHGAVAAAARARLREREETLRLRLHAAAVALRADDGRAAGLRAGAAALATRRHELDGHLRLDAAERVLEGEMDLDLDV